MGEVIGEGKIVFGIITGRAVVVVFAFNLFFAADSLPVRVALFPSTISSRMVIGRNLLCGSVELRGGSFWIVDSVTRRY